MLAGGLLRLRRCCQDTLGCSSWWRLATEKARTRAEFAFLELARARCFSRRGYDSRELHCEPIGNCTLNNPN